MFSLETANIEKAINNAKALHPKVKMIEINVSTARPPVARETPTDRARREIRFARTLASEDALTYETQDAICRALTAALRYLDDEAGQPPHDA
jgi:hypothetical protein